GGRWRAGRPDDPWRRTAIALARAAARMAPPSSRRRPPRGLEALRLRAASRGPARLAVEARLLAGQDDAAIAARTGLAEDTVAAYAALFFDVQPLLACPDAVRLRAIGARIYR